MAIEKVKKKKDRKEPKKNSIYTRTQKKVSLKTVMMKLDCAFDKVASKVRKYSSTVYILLN